MYTKQYTYIGRLLSVSLVLSQFMALGLESSLIECSILIDLLGQCMSEPNKCMCILAWFPQGDCKFLKKFFKTSESFPNRTDAEVSVCIFHITIR